MSIRSFDYSQPGRRVYQRFALPDEDLPELETKTAPKPKRKPKAKPKVKKPKVPLTRGIIPFHDLPEEIQDQAIHDPHWDH